MTARRSVLITGAAGNLGGKLRRHLEGRHDLRLLDREPRGDAAITPADLSRWDPAWERLFVGDDRLPRAKGGSSEAAW
jgi:nucleoside-diphosphate-sugar epimerase